MNVTHSHRTASVSPARAGFSLTELSVVLVLVSLLVGGITTGLNIKHTAELKSVSDDVMHLREIVDIFKQRYQNLPGDMYNATKYWGAADADFDDCKTTVSTSHATCNGDGNNSITTPGDGDTYYEAHRFWQHLVNAQLMDGTYTGHRAGTDDDATCLSNSHCGQSNFKNGSYYPVTVKEEVDYFQPDGLTGLLMYPGDKGNALVLFRNSNEGGANGAFVGAPLLTAEDTYNLDMKFDDGKPASGNMQTFKPESGSDYLDNVCATSDDESLAKYNISSNGAQCAIIYTNMF